MPHSSNIRVSKMPDSPVGPLYVIIVHGTKLGTAQSSWWKRESAGEFPFCRRLSERLLSVELPYQVWQSVEDLGISEFEWSGENTHGARLDAGRRLGSYITSLHKSALSKAKKVPVFCLIGHSHGGNVILSSIGHIAKNVEICCIYFLGTPFFLYSHNINTIAGRPHNRPYNLYLTGVPPHRTVIRIWTSSILTDSGEIHYDEVESLLIYLQERTFMKSNIEHMVSSLKKPFRWTRIDRHKVWQSDFYSVGETNTMADLSWVTFHNTHPSMNQIILGYLRQTISMITWPFKYLFLTISSATLSRLLMRRLFEIRSGLDANLYSLQKIRFSTVPGFTPHPDGMHINRQVLFLETPIIWKFIQENMSS